MTLQHASPTCMEWPTAGLLTEAASGPRGSMRGDPGAACSSARPCACAACLRTACSGTHMLLGCSAHQG
jgi:hypothetical protein